MRPFRLYATIFPQSHRIGISFFAFLLILIVYHSSTKKSITYKKYLYIFMLSLFAFQRFFNVFFYPVKIVHNGISQKPIRFHSVCHVCVKTFAFQYCNNSSCFLVCVTFPRACSALVSVQHIHPIFVACTARTVVFACPLMYIILLP